MKALVKRYKEEGAEGFTLIELLIVIVILGILSTVVVFAVQGITNKGQGASCSADKNTLQVAVESYYANYGFYPTSQDALTSPQSGAPSSSNAGLLRTKSNSYTVDTIAASGSTPASGTGKVVLITNNAVGYTTATSVAGNSCTN